MIVKFWGVRGSIATPGKDTCLYGGNTSCVEIRTDAGDIIIIDMGTGIRPLGYSLLKEFADQPIIADILITHTHWDHIQGLPFFSPILHPTHKFHIYGMDHVSRAIENMMKVEYFPITLKELGAKISFKSVKQGEKFFLGKNRNIKVETELLPHPGGCLGYRIQGESGEIYVHVCDCEQPRSGLDQGVIKLAQGADFLVHDSQYTPEEMEDGYKRGWGHSSWDKVIKVGKKAGVKKLALFHHDPIHTDDFLADTERLVIKNSDVETLIAKEGMVLKI